MTYIDPLNELKKSLEDIHNKLSILSRKNPKLYIYTAPVIESIDISLQEINKKNNRSIKKFR